MKQKISKLVPKKSTFSRTTPSRLWFMSKGYDHIDPTLVFGHIFYIRVKGQDVSILNANGCNGRTIPLDCAYQGFDGYLCDCCHDDLFD